MLMDKVRVRKAQTTIKEFMSALDAHPDYPGDVAQCSYVAWQFSNHRGKKLFEQDLDDVALIACSAEWLQQRYCHLQKTAPVPRAILASWMISAIYCDVIQRVVQNVLATTLDKRWQELDVSDFKEGQEGYIAACRKVVELVTHLPIGRAMTDVEHFACGYVGTPDVPTVRASIHDSKDQELWSDSELVPREAGHYIVLRLRPGADRRAAYAALSHAWRHVDKEFGYGVGQRRRGGAINYHAHVEIYSAWRRWQQTTGENKPARFVTAIFDGTVRLQQWGDAPPSETGIRTQLAQACRWLEPSDRVPATFTAHMARYPQWKELLVFMQADSAAKLKG